MFRIEIDVKATNKIVFKYDKFKKECFKFVQYISKFKYVVSETAAVN